MERESSSRGDTITVGRHGRAPHNSALARRAASARHRPNRAVLATASSSAINITQRTSRFSCDSTLPPCSTGRFVRHPKPATFDGYAENGIDYNYTNVAQDAHNYPILHDRHGVTSDHLETAQTVYEPVREFSLNRRQMQSHVLLRCRSGLLGHSRSGCPSGCRDTARRRAPRLLQIAAIHFGEWVFQKQLIELEAKVKGEATSGPSTLMPPDGKREFSNAYGSIGGKAPKTNDPSKELVLELTVPGLRTFDVVVPKESTPAELKEVLLKPVDEHLRRRSRAACTLVEVARARLASRSSSSRRLLTARSITSSWSLRRLRWARSSRGCHRRSV